MLVHLVIVLSCLKLLLMPCYTSTDFEVHRNWLAITDSLPVDEWYTESRSQWTLDYPPLFAWFERSLAYVERLTGVDDAMLDVDNLGHKSNGTVFFQRATVIATDIVLVAGVKVCADALAGNQAVSESLLYHLPALVLTNAGLYIVDHIHFQYNGFLLGIFLCSVGSMLAGKHLLSAFLFAVLLNLKHIYLYCAPAYFVYLLSTYCRPKKPEFPSILGISLSRVSVLATIVVATMAASFGPFVVRGQLFTVLGRLFPFKRGLTHAYWAPNFWAVYNGFDRLALAVAHRLGIEANCASPTGGLVQDTKHCLLPNVPPAATFCLTLLFQLPVLVKLWKSPGKPIQFLRSAVLCNYASFVFGWHVHEKAILLVTVPMAVLAIVSATEAKFFVVLSTVANFSLFPLLHEAQETNIKCALLLWHLTVVLAAVSQRKRAQQRSLGSAEKLYLAGLVPVFMFSQFAWAIPGLAKFEFLPLLAYSIYSSVGVISIFLVQTKHFVLS